MAPISQPMHGSNVVPFARTRVALLNSRPPMVQRLHDGLSSAGILVVLVTPSHRGAPLLRELRDHAPHVVLLSGTPTSRDSISLAGKLRHEPDRPGILFLTSGTCPASVLSLADDYASEDSRPSDLALRVEVLHARRSASAVRSPRTHVPGLQVLPESRRVLLHGREIYLTVTEFDILHLLTANAGRVVPKREILDSVWRHNFDGESNIVETYISILRRKLRDHRTLIVTVRGIGYRMAISE